MWWEWLAVSILLMPLFVLMGWTAFRSPKALVVVAPVLLLVAALVAGPVFTDHRLVGDELILRQGLHFSARIDVEDIVSVRPVNGWPFGIGVRTNLGSSRVWVITGARNLVEIALSRPADARLMGFTLRGRDRIIINLADPDRFLTIVSGRL